MKITKHEMKEYWENNKRDKDRLNYLISNRFCLPEDMKINIDNDHVFITFESENYDRWKTAIGLDFNTYGYELLLDLFLAIGLKADMV